MSEVATKTWREECYRLRAEVEALRGERDKYREAARILRSIAVFAEHMGIVDSVPSARRGFEATRWLDAADEKETT